MAKKKLDEASRAAEILAILKESYPDAKIALAYRTPFQLLVATILSAQCTDERVNIVTKELFKRYKAPKDYVAADDEELKKDIYSTGFFNRKAKSLKNCCAALEERHGGKVPKSFEALAELPGVGRKTASVVAGNAFGIPAVAVDTHVRRLSNLLGFIDTKNPDKIEFRLRELFPESEWVTLGHLLMSHGRAVCKARKPECPRCPLAELCPSAKT
ncbi:MAG: endonuclease III [Ignavibacteriales bacterium]|nr:endonuclease III [Ignavibacteriales bacterium]